MHLGKRADAKVGAMQVKRPAVTSTSPLQYQKTLGPHAARRMLSTNADATAAAYAAGYEGASQFSREYGHLFGRPPKQGARHRRANVGELSEVLV